MVALPQMDSSALGDHMDSHVHPAWLCGSQELKVVYISKFQNIIYNHRAYSLPLQLPATFVSFDEAYLPVLKKVRLGDHSRCTLERDCAVVQKKSKLCLMETTILAMTFSPRRKQGVEKHLVP